MDQAIIVNVHFQDNEYLFHLNLDDTVREVLLLCLTPLCNHPGPCQLKEMIQMQLAVPTERQLLLDLDRFSSSGCFHKACESAGCNDEHG